MEKDDVCYKSARDGFPSSHAEHILVAAAGHMRQRAETYDAPGGERSMEKTVALFNVLHGTDLTVVDGWRFMALLKLVRSTQGAYRADNFEDLAAYAALAGEDAAMVAAAEDGES
jgi:hypothetical protein